MKKDWQLELASIVSSWCNSSQTNLTTFASARTGSLRCSQHRNSHQIQPVGLPFHLRRSVGTRFRSARGFVTRPGRPNLIHRGVSSHGGQSTQHVLVDISLGLREPKFGAVHLDLLDCSHRLMFAEHQNNPWFWCKGHYVSNKGRLTITAKQGL